MLQRARNELADHGEAEPADIQAPGADEGADPAIEIEGAWEDEWFTEDAESEATEDDEEMAYAEEAEEADGGAGYSFAECCVLSGYVTCLSVMLATLARWRLGTSIQSNSYHCLCMAEYHVHL